MPLPRHPLALDLSPPPPPWSLPGCEQPLGACSLAGPCNFPRPWSVLAPGIAVSAGCAWGLGASESPPGRRGQELGQPRVPLEHVLVATDRLLNSRFSKKNKKWFYVAVQL